MSLRDEAWPAGTPCWVDLMSSDRLAAWEFYRTVFGWEIVDSGEEFGHYGMASLHGRPVAGIGEIPPGNPMPVAWTTYLASEDAAATTASITANGGTVMVAPAEVGDQGLFAVAADPTGAVFGVWQAEKMIGCGVVNEPGALVWNECMTRDAAAARAFYSAVFGYTFRTMEGGMDYQLIEGDGAGGTIGGVGQLDANFPAEMPAHWNLYFQVADTDATIGVVTANGGSVMMPAWDTPFGRMAIVADPQGGVFALMSAPPDAGAAQA